MRFLKIVLKFLFLGSTVKPLVDLLKIDKYEEKTLGKGKISNDVHGKNIDHVMSGINSIVGKKISTNKFWNTIRQFDQKFIRKYLVLDTGEHPWEIKMEKISLNDHYTRLYGPDLMVKQKKVQDMLSVEKISKKLCKILE